MLLLKQILKYLWAWVRWRYHGSPKRSPLDVELTFMFFCEPCVHYHPGLGECTLCGCSVSLKSIGRNKIIFETEHCPKGYW